MWGDAVIAIFDGLAQAVALNPVLGGVLALLVLAMARAGRETYNANLEALAEDPCDLEGGKYDSALDDRRRELKLRGFERYQNNVQHLLNGMAVFIGDGKGAMVPPRLGWTTGALRFSNGSPQSLLFALGFASVYPVLLMLATWGWLGEGAAFGSFIALPDTPTEHSRVPAQLFELAAITILATLLWYSLPVDPRNGLVRLCFALFAGTALALALAGVHWIALLFALGAALLAKGPLAATMAWTCTGFVALALCSRELNPVWAFAPALGAVAIFRIAEWLDEKPFGRSVGLVGVTCAAIAWLLLLIWWAGGSQASPVVGSLARIPPREALVILCVLPLANGVCDWASFTLTRFLMQKAVQLPYLAGAKGWQVAANWVSVGWAAFFFFCDVVFALVLTLSVTAMVIVGLHVFNLALVVLGSNLAPIDITSLLESIRDGTAGFQHVWIFLMLYSTLLPTVAHLVVAAYSLVHLIPIADYADLESRIVSDRNHADKRRRLARQLTFVHVADDLLVAIFVVTIGGAILASPAPAFVAEFIGQVAQDAASIRLQGP